MRQMRRHNLKRRRWTLSFCKRTNHGEAHARSGIAALIREKLKNRGLHVPQTRKGWHRYWSVKPMIRWPIGSRELNKMMN